MTAFPRVHTHTPNGRFSQKNVGVMGGMLICTYIWLFKNSLDFVAFGLTAKYARCCHPENSLLGPNRHTHSHHHRFDVHVGTHVWRPTKAAEWEWERERTREGEWAKERVRVNRRKTPTICGCVSYIHTYVSLILYPYLYPIDVCFRVSR